MSTEDTFSCPKCHAGMLHLTELTYFARLGDELLVVPKFPAWTCDICGYVEYDEQALAWLYTLLSPSMQHREKPSASRGAAQPSAKE